MKKILLFSLIVLAPGCSPTFLSTKENNFVVIAHRGDHTKAPENTLPAFGHAIDLGVDYVEVDLRTTLDKVLIVMHDASIDRMTDAHGVISEMTFQELDTLKVYDKEHPSFGEFPIPRLADVLALCKNKVKIYLDFKAAEVPATLEVFQNYQMTNSLVVYVNSMEQYKAWRLHAPKVPLIVSLPDSVTNRHTLSNFLEHVDAEILDGHFSQYTTEMVKLASEKGRVVWADIQQKNENPELWDKAIETNLHGLQTDSPLKLIHYLKSKRLRK